VVVGLALLLAGAGVLGWVGWEYVGTNVVSHHRQAEQRARLHRSWQQGRTPTAWGDAFALLRVPRWGPHYEMPIIRGVDDDALAAGVGWFPRSARPGRIGNFALAAHRVTHGEPFRDCPELRRGDDVYVETRTHVYTYQLDDNGTDHEVPFTQSWILDPVPGHPDAEPTQALITLTTCSELFHTEERSYVFGHLVATERK
jgi:sortase A